jgi:hypothetical protein
MKAFRRRQSTGMRQGKTTCKSRSIVMDKRDTLVVEHLVDRPLHPERLAQTTDHIGAKSEQAFSDANHIRHAGFHILPFALGVSVRQVKTESRNGRVERDDASSVPANDRFGQVQQHASVPSSLHILPNGNQAERGSSMVQKIDADRAHDLVIEDKYVRKIARFRFAGVVRIVNLLRSIGFEDRVAAYRVVGTPVRI